ncbi:MAG: biotin--[acetyl-CoA-carboxylase] ligase [Acidimicrobiia bacterium]|nr:biotin--[acetyl-CoA-carboxylase] ligase [Acidimicrobiia bacterium]
MNLPSHVRHVPDTGSTNQDLLDLLKAGATEVRAILADHQTAGRGRLGRSWHDEPEVEVGPGGPSGPQAMTGSIALRWNDAADPGLPLVPFAAGLATLDVVHAILGDGSGVGLGWPNDVIVRRGGVWRKLAGVLVETVPLPETSSFGVVVGVGLNLLPVVSAPPEVCARAISLSELRTGEARRKNDSNVDIFLRLLSTLETRMASLRRNPRSFMDTYRASCITIGERVAYQTSDGPREGLAEGVADSGEILIGTATGTVAVSVGDVQAL